MPNLNEDPWERRNLAGRTNFRGLMQELAGKIRDWQMHTSDEVALPDPLFR